MLDMSAIGVCWGGELGPKRDISHICDCFVFGPTEKFWKAARDWVRDGVRGGLILNTDWESHL